MQLQPGTVLSGKYRIEHEIGRGGMGIVYAATHLHIGRRVALKALRGGPGTATRRLLQEARATARLRSPHVVALLDADVLPNGEAYLAMELLDGEDLASLLAREAPLPVGVATHFARQVCDALDEAASHGIVHRDLKPANLFVSRTSGGPCIKVLDFGISKAPTTAAGGVGLTSTGAALGTPHYMSPEQVRGTPAVDARADVWSLGVVMYEMLTGQRPFEGTTSFEICERVVHASVLPPSRHRRELSSELDAVLLRCLDKLPERRYSSARELWRALAPFADGEPASRPLPSPRFDTTRDIPGAVAGAPGASLARRRPVAGLRWVALVAAGALAAMAWQRLPSSAGVPAAEVPEQGAAPAARALSLVPSGPAPGSAAPGTSSGAAFTADAEVPDAPTPPQPAEAAESSVPHSAPAKPRRAAPRPEPASPPDARPQATEPLLDLGVPGRRSRQ